MENSFELSRYLINPGHKLTVAVIGCGGTGSWVLGDLIALHHYLVETGRPGLKVTAFDPDIVTEANLGRQNFNHSDLNENKAMVLIEKYNRYWGLNWESEERKWDKEEDTKFNIIISCVDTVASRVDIINGFKSKNHYSYDRNEKHLLIDCGNGYDYGQVIVTRYETKDKTFSDWFPEQKESIETHSCSVLESLGKQNLFINKFIANLAVNWLYEAFRNTTQDNLGYFFSFNTLTKINYE